MKSGPPRVILDKSAYMRAKNAERRANAVANGLCVHCSHKNDRLPKRTCSGCAYAQKFRTYTKSEP